jgi:hypothetical protein
MYAVFQRNSFHFLSLLSLVCIQRLNKKNRIISISKLIDFMYVDITTPSSTENFGVSVYFPGIFCQLCSVYGYLGKQRFFLY